jgi:RecA/RadA recombinase
MERTEIAENLIRSGAIDIVVIDLGCRIDTKKSEIEGEMGDSKWTSRKFDVTSFEKINGNN